MGSPMPRMPQQLAHLGAPEPDAIVLHQQRVRTAAYALGPLVSSRAAPPHWRLATPLTARLTAPLAARLTAPLAVHRLAVHRLAAERQRLDA